MIKTSQFKEALEIVKGKGKLKDHCQFIYGVSYEKLLEKSRGHNWRDLQIYRIWKALCRWRDGNECTLSGLKNNLEIHHLEHGAYNPELRYDWDNGITVEKELHKSFHSNLIGNYTMNCTRERWQDFEECYKTITKANLESINLLMLRK